MLNDKDRIFTNIYGWQEPNLTAAKKRGDWDDTKGILSLGHDEIVERMKQNSLSYLEKQLRKNKSIKISDFKKVVQEINN